jgi:hypothetical protein
MLALSSVEHVFFARSAQLGKSDAAGLEANDVEVEALGAVLNEYRRIASAFAQTRAAEAQLRTGLRSRETLLLWIGYCLLHEAALDDAPELASYSPALDWRELRLLMLEDKAAVDAVLHVAAYPQDKQAPEGKPVFSLFRATRRLTLHASTRSTCTARHGRPSMRRLRSGRRHTMRKCFASREAAHP